MKLVEGDRPGGPAGGGSLSGSTIDEPPSSSEPRAVIPRSSSTYDTYPLPFSTQPRDPQRYVFLGEHGRGGLGRVLRAHDRELGRDIAVKELLAHGDLDEVRFVREVVITARLEHPGIVPIHEAGRWPDGTPFYAMKLVSGRSLHDLIADCTTIDARIALLHHVIAVTDAIAYAHGRDIIHRDLKPANVIIGEFGETVVIDWGLAKDLRTRDEPVAPNGPFRASENDELTKAGSVLGTPAYMSPEQKRGGRVDQRTDVYAIGIMLWELCSTERTPPEDVRARHRVLRRAGIDADLATIIDKALEPELERRYRDASELAADLKAFKSGARISARDYSLLAMLAHWTRRHRGLAIATCAAVALVFVASVLVVLNIAAERDRADASELKTQAALGDLTLHFAETLVTKDASAVPEVLAGYNGTELVRLEQIRAEAYGRGVAIWRARPHTQGVYWTIAAPDGSVLSLSTDGTIARTDSHGRSSVVARGVAKVAIPAYSPARRLLAYTCDPLDICLFDVARAAPLPTPVLSNRAIRGIAFSPTGNLLVATTREGTLLVFEITNPGQPALRLTKEIPGGTAVSFIDEEVVAVATATGVELVRLTGDSQRFVTDSFSFWATSASEHKLVLATETGRGIVFEGSPFTITKQIELCSGTVNSVQFVPGSQRVAYACRSGTVGIWDLQRNVVTPRAQLDGHAGLVGTSPDGEYIVAAGGNGLVTVIDLQTGLNAWYRGHAFRLTSLTPPTREHPFVISADYQGSIRTWPLPTRLARVAATSSSPFLSAIFDAGSPAVIVTTWRPSLTIVSAAGATPEIGSHEPFNIFLEQSEGGDRFAAYGLSDRVEIWPAATLVEPRVISTGHGSVSQVKFTDQRDEIITVGNDGRALRWSGSSEPTLLARMNQPIDKVAWLRATDSVVFSTADGALWRSLPGGTAAPLRGAGVQVARVLSVAAHHAVYVGYANGDVVAIDTGSWRQGIVRHGAGPVQEIAVSDKGHTMAITTGDGTIHVATWREGAMAPTAGTWTTLAASALHLKLTSDGLLVAASTDGTIWLYSVPRQRWMCLPTGTADITRLVVRGDGKAAVVLDREGRLIKVDLEAARALLDISSTSLTQATGTRKP
ncbi:MAG: protein kinase [Myxococcales bacterium]|nr:protein kinase [Myxococcales bacterium]